MTITPDDKRRAVIAAVAARRLRTERLVALAAFLTGRSKPIEAT